MYTYSYICIHIAYRHCIMMYELLECVYADQLQGESSVSTVQRSTKKRLVEGTEGNLSIEVSENPKSKKYNIAM